MVVVLLLVILVAILVTGVVRVTLEVVRGVVVVQGSIGMVKVVVVQEWLEVMVVSKFVMMMIEMVFENFPLMMLMMLMMFVSVGVRKMVKGMMMTLMVVLMMLLSFLYEIQRLRTTIRLLLCPDTHTFCWPWSSEKTFSSCSSKLCQAILHNCHLLLP